MCCCLAVKLLCSIVRKCSICSRAMCAPAAVYIIRPGVCTGHAWLSYETVGYQADITHGAIAALSHAHMVVQRMRERRLTGARCKERNIRQCLGLLWDVGILLPAVQQYHHQHETAHSKFHLAWWQMCQHGCSDRGAHSLMQRYGVQCKQKPMTTLSTRRAEEHTHTHCLYGYAGSLEVST